MSLHTPATSQSFGRTFIVAASVLGAVAVLQLGAVTWAFFSKSGSIAKTDDAPSVPPAKIDISNFPVVEPDEPLTANSDPISDSRPFPVNPSPLRLDGPTGERPERPLAVPENLASPGLAASSGPGSMLRPTPVPLSAFTPKQDPRFAELIEQGKLLRNTGDTGGALVKFREAALLEPSNPLPIAETAYTFERMSLNDKAAEQWRRIIAMGEGAGVYFSAAQAKLNMAISDVSRSLAPSTGSTQIAEGKTLAISPARMEDDADPSSAKKFILHVPIRAKSGQEVSVRDMKVFVLFYERLNGKDIVRTSANVSNRWENPPVDWSEGEETLEVLYDLPPSDGAGEPRSYYGYIIRLYYQGELQDTQAQPSTLNQKFPADYHLSE